MLQSYVYNLLDSILCTNKQFELIDIIGSDNRIRDGVVNSQIESVTAKLKQFQRSVEYKQKQVQIVNSVQEFNTLRNSLQILTTSKTGKAIQKN